MNITPMDFKCLLKWYNSNDFKYATGIERCITLQQLAKMYNKVQDSEEQFWVGIFISSTSEMIGVLMGQIKYGAKASVWIKTLIIDKAFQNKGYGFRIVNLFINYVKIKSKISKAYLAVSECNVRGYKFWKRLGFERYRRINQCSLFGEKATDATNAIIMFRSV